MNQVASLLQNDESVREKVFGFTQGGVTAKYGNLLTLPVGGGLLYVQPVYTQRQGSGGAYPALQFVMVRFGQRVGIGDTLKEALDQVFPGNSSVDTGETPTEPQPTTPGTGTGTGGNAAATAALAQAKAAYAAANTALEKGDLATYQAQIKRAEAAVNRAITALDG